MGPIHCPLCIGLALLSVLRTAAYGVLMARMAGFGSNPAAPARVPIRGPALAH
jgi:hypothetical protein